MDSDTALSQRLQQLSAAVAVFAAPADGLKDDVTLIMPAFGAVPTAKEDEPFATARYLQHRRGLKFRLSN